MQKIIYFLIRNKNFILFLALLTVSLAVNFNFNEYNRSKIMNSSNFIISSLYEAKFSVTKYLNLEYQNKLLIDKNLKLKEIIYNSKNPIEISKKIEEMDFDFIASSVIKNSYTKTKNYITIDKGLIDSITIDNGVISSNGVVGIIDKSTSNYSRVISILNENFMLNAKLKNSNSFGVLSWNGRNINKVQLKDLPKQVDIKIGDTIVTGGNSYIFPKDVLIGYVDSYKLDNSENYLEVEIILSTDMTNIENLYIIRNNNIFELNSLDE